MKKTFLVLFACAAFSTCFAQLQRLAVLPSALKMAGSEVGNLPSICLDYFREAPYNQTLSHGKNSAGGAFDQLADAELHANSYSSVDFRKNGQVVDRQLDDVSFASPQGDLDGISSGKADFLRDRVNYFKNRGGFNHSDLYELQNEIWAYDVLEILGYISDKEATAVRFANSKGRFAEDFGLNEATVLDDDVLSIAARLKTKDNSMTIARKAGSNTFILFEGLGPKNSPAIWTISLIMSPRAHRQTCPCNCKSPTLKLTSMRTYS